MESPTDTFRWWFHRWFYRWQCHVTIRLSQFESLDHSIGKIIWKIVCRRYGRYIPTEIFHRYIPTVSPISLFSRYIPTDFETEFSPTVIPLVFFGFLVVWPTPRGTRPYLDEGSNILSFFLTDFYKHALSTLGESI